MSEVAIALRARGISERLNAAWAHVKFNSALLSDEGESDDELYFGTQATSSSAMAAPQLCKEQDDKLPLPRSAEPTDAAGFPRESDVYLPPANAAESPHPNGIYLPSTNAARSSRETDLYYRPANGTMAKQVSSSAFATSDSLSRDGSITAIPQASSSLTPTFPPRGTPFNAEEPSLMKEMVPANQFDPLNLKHTVPVNHTDQEAVAASVKPKKRRRPGPYICQCGRSYSGGQELAHHRQYSSLDKCQERLTCCGLTLSSNISLEIHNERFHPSDTDLTCQCGKLCKNKKALTSHRYSCKRSERNSRSTV